MTGRRPGSDHQNRLNSAGRPNAGNPRSNPGLPSFQRDRPRRMTCLTRRGGPVGFGALNRPSGKPVHAAIDWKRLPVGTSVAAGVNTINEFAKMGGKPGDLRTRLENLTAEQGESNG